MGKLYDLSRKFFDTELKIDKEEAECLCKSVEKFCRTGKKEDAFSVYFCYCEIYKIFGSGYNTMSKLLEFLSDHEYHSGELLAKHRDHYSHSVYVFALGLAVYANDGAFAKIFNDFYEDNLDNTQFLYLWGMTALFHDIGYPFQLAHEQIKSYTSQIWGENYDQNPFVSYDNMDNILRLKDSVNNACEEYRKFDTLNQLFAYGVQSRMGYPFETVLQILDARFLHQNRFMDHAYFSAVLLANQLMDSQKQFDTEITDVLTAILLHNSLNRHDFKGTVSPYKHPLAYLLALCDELQNWDRTAFGFISKKDPLAWKVDIEIKDSYLSIDYYFDNFNVCSPADKDNVRINRNVEKLQSGAFVVEILKLFEYDDDYRLELHAVAKQAEKDKKGVQFASSDKFINLCDFARAIHFSYQKEYGGKSFDELSLEFKLSNIEQAKSYPEKLELINCFYSDRELDYPIVDAFTNLEDYGSKTRKDLGFLAREEHLRWVKEKLANGWKYGTDYRTDDDNRERDSKKIHKDLVPFDFLEEDEKKKDVMMIANMIPFLYEKGHGIRIYSYRSGRKPVLEIAGFGHRTVPMNDKRIKDEVKSILMSYAKDYRVVVRTNFAFGADQLITECANELGLTIKAALPFEYEKSIEKVRSDAAKYGYKFTKDDEDRMRGLMAQTVSCKYFEDEEFAYREAAKHIIKKCMKVIAIWDGVETLLQDGNGKPINQGGTWYKICLAKNSRGLRDEDIHIIKCER